MKKAIPIIVVILIAIPVLPRLMPTPLTMDGIEAGFKAAGFTVADMQTPAPQLGAVEERLMTVNGASVEVYRFEDEGKIATQLEYQKPDSGSAIVETWNLSESLGAAKPKSKPVSASRNGMFMLVVIGEDKALRDRVVQAFNRL